jgi:hypothetical protein
MDILWPAIGIAVIVAFAFYVLARHWQRLLRQQNWTIRRLFERVQSLEELADPEWRRRLGDTAPVPLEQVVNFSFRLDDRFWRETLGLSSADEKSIREYGSFVGAVKLERWRSHTVATITEVLPDRKATGWQTRALDFYPDAGRTTDALSLWELALARPAFSAARPPSLELVLRANSIELRGHLISAATGPSGNGHGAAANSTDDDAEITFFRVPLDAAGLAEFRSHDPANSAAGSIGHASGDGNGGEGRNDNANGNGAGASASLNGNSWQAFYSHEIAELGIEWQLRLRDLTRKSEWERWKILESPAIPTQVS